MSALAAPTHDNGGSVARTGEGVSAGAGVEGFAEKDP